MLRLATLLNRTINIVAFLCFVLDATNEVFDEVFVRRGDNVTLSCGLNDTTLIIWKTPNGTQIPLSLSDDTGGRKLMVISINFEDAGLYSCVSYSLDNQQSVEHKRIVVADIPDPPFNISLNPKSSTSLLASWSFGNDRNSPVLLHSLYLYERDNLVKHQNVSAPLHSLLISGLEPSKCYSLIMRSLNNFGWSILSRAVHSVTFQSELKLRPTISVHNVSSSSIMLQVDQSELIASDPANISVGCKTFSYPHNYTTFNRSYTILVSPLDDPNLIEEYVQPISSQPYELITVRGLRPYTQYNISSSVWDGRTNGPATHLLVRTAEAVPPPPEFISSSSTNNSITIHWMNPKNTSGVLVGYKLELYRCVTDESKEPDASLRLRNQQLSAIPKEFTFEVLDSNVCYAVRIAAATSAGFGRFSELYSVHTDIPNPAPPELISATFVDPNSILLNWTCSGPCTSHRDLSQNYYVVCWSTMSSSHQPKCLPTQVLDSNYRSFCNCDASKKFHTTLLPRSIMQDPNTSRIVFTVRSVRKRSTCRPGDDCEKQSLDSNPVAVILAVSRGFKVDSTAIVGIVAICLFVISAVAFGSCLATRIQCKAYGCYRYKFCSHSVEIPACKYRRAVPLRFTKSNYEPILASELHDHVAASHANNDAGFQAEFDAIEQTIANDEWTTCVAKLPENSSKNRYSNVLAYDHTRVILKETNGKSDYINANYIDGYHRRAAYIAAQGPTPTTFDDFWLMVWEQACNVIVMISNFIERGRRKCDKYWPTNGQQLYGTICVRILSETVRAFYTTRVFAIRHIRCKRSTKERLVYHYQYTDWRDFDVPLSPLPVLKFVEASVTHWTLEDGPIVVHCSAGVGRTGTYICIESLIRQLKAEKLVTIRAFLEHIRRQRMKLVQTEQQYAFIHDALREFVLNPSHVIRPAHFTDYLSRLRALDSSGRTNLEKLFEVCVESDDAHQLKSASMSIKRRGSCSVFGSVATELLGTNSSSLHGYQTLSEYIVARHPLAGIESEFWKMVWEENASLIICLSSPDLPSFWPTNSHEIRDIGWLHVSYAGNNPCGDSLIRYEFLLTSDREDYALACSLWRLVEWGSDGSESQGDLKLVHSLLDLVSHTVDDADDDDMESRSSGGSIVVVDDNAGQRVGTFCALRILINQFTHEGCFDVYFVFKMLCVQRPGMFHSYRDLEFIYTLLEHFLLDIEEGNFVTSECRNLIQCSSMHPFNRSSPGHSRRRSKPPIMSSLFQHKRKTRVQRIENEVRPAAFSSLLSSFARDSSPLECDSSLFGSLRHTSLGSTSHVSSIANSSEPVATFSQRSQSDQLLSNTKESLSHDSALSLPIAC